VATAREDNDRRAHPQSFAGRGRTVVGKGIKRDINFTVGGQVLELTRGVGRRSGTCQPQTDTRFEDAVHAERWCKAYFHWYNGDHHHSGLGGFTPEQVFTGRYPTIAEHKQRVLDAYYAKAPERFVQGRPRVSMPPPFVAINPILSEVDGHPIADRVNFPTLTAAGYVSEK
jgi:hypothetical protein